MLEPNARNTITDMLQKRNAWLFELERMGFKLSFVDNRNQWFPNELLPTVSDYIDNFVDKMFDKRYFYCSTNLDEAYNKITASLGGASAPHNWCATNQMWFVNPLTISYFDLLKRRHQRAKKEKDLGDLERLPPDTLDMIFGTQRRSAATLALFLL